jgi:adenylate kinase
MWWRIYQRADDSLEKVSVRLDVYVKQTKPLINYYLNKGLLVDIDALDSIDAINERIEKALEAI